MKRVTFKIGMLSILFLISCGTKKYGCNPGRRCETINKTGNHLNHEEIIKKDIKNC